MTGEGREAVVLTSIAGILITQKGILLFFVSLCTERNVQQTHLKKMYNYGTSKRCPSQKD